MKLEKLVNYIDEQIKLMETNYEATKSEILLAQIIALLKVKSFIIGEIS